MATIKPFRGIRYNAQRFADQMNRLVAPPYDVIDDEQLSALYERHINNIVRMELNKHAETDQAENNRYTRARRYLMDWLAEGDLIIEDRPVLYVHEQTFEDERGNQIKRRGFIGLVELAEYSEKIVLPHERTLRGPKEDRLALMKATECNLSQIFMLYDDSEDVVAEILAAACEGQPIIDITTPDGIQHVMWRVVDVEAQEKVVAFFGDQQLLIADGHHRYETALAYRDFRRECAEIDSSSAPYDYVMTFLVNMHDEGLVIFPTHRVVHSWPQFDAQSLRVTLDESPYFELTELDANSTPEALTEQLEQAGQEVPSFVLLCKQWSAPLLVKFVGDVNAELFRDETPDDVRALDVAVLHEGILERVLGIDLSVQAEGTHIDYYKKFNEAMNAHAAEQTQLTVIMNATPIEQVASVCRSGGKMPQKSTYFYPKILSGLVINPL